jgi:plastocyanin
MRLGARAGALGAVLIVGAAAAAVPALAAKTRTVTVNDNYYGPTKLTIHAGDTVRWRWSDDLTDVHDVKLAKAPSGVRKFASDPLAAGDTFKRKLTKVGTYKIICTFHEEEMRMTITVRKALR